MIRLQKIKVLNWLGMLIVVSLVLTGCNLPQSAPSGSAPTAAITEEVIELPNIPPSTEETPIPVTVEGQEQPAVEETSQVFLPQIEKPEGSTQGELPVEQATSAETPSPESPSSIQGPNTELAYLHEGNLFLVEIPSGSPRQLTSENDLLSFEWSPDGMNIATYNGKNLCFVQRDSSSLGECIDLKLDDTQAKIQRQILWSPDQKNIILWNSVNPWDEEAIGWLLVSVDGAAEPIVINDPVDYGAEITAENDAGGITGEPIFLPDGTLIGTITHRWWCGSGGCHYQLFQFDPETRDFSVFPNKPEEGFSEGQQLVLSQNGKTLINHGTFTSSCDNYFSFVDFFDLETQTRAIFNLTQEALAELALSPDNQFAVISRTSGCSDPNQVTWASACGLSSGLDVYPMQIWELANDQRSDLLPGINPAWSSNGYWLVFTSCLTQNANGIWETNPQGSPELMVRSFVDGAIIKIGVGTQPSWRP